MDDTKTRILDLIASGDYVYTNKASLLATEDGLEHEDVVESIRNGKLLKKERDLEDKTVWVWTWLGRGRSGVLVWSQGKIWKDEDGQYYLIISAHKPRPRAP